MQNSEGIYGSFPWIIQNELLSEKKKEKILQSNVDKNTMKDNLNDATSKVIFPEVRFTSRDNYIYAYVCSYHKKQVLIKSLRSENNGDIKNIIQLNTSKKVTWEQNNEGVIINMPDYNEEEIPIIGFRIELK